MKLYGHSGDGNLTHEVTPSALAEITLVASPAELRRIADFLVAGAATMERMGASYTHQHLADSDHSFRSSPHFVIAPTGSNAG